MPVLSNDQFLDELSKMAKTVTLAGAVSVTFKRCKECMILIIHR